MKLALITGGSGYIGSAITKALESHGYTVASLSRSSGVDVTNEAAVTQAVEAAVAQHGAVYACVHAAAVPLIRKPLLHIEPNEFDSEVMTAAKGAYLLARAAHKHLAPEAVFIGITSEAIEKGEPAGSNGAYVTAKYALRGVLRSLAAQLPRVYAVAPGFLPGGLNSDIPEAARDMLAKKYESPSPDDIAALVVELCEGSTIPTGMSVRVDRSYEPL